MTNLGSHLGHRAVSLQLQGVNLKKLQKGVSLTPLSSGLITQVLRKRNSLFSKFPIPLLSFFCSSQHLRRKYIKDHPIVTMCLIYFLCKCRRQTFWEEHLTPEFRLVPQCSAAYIPGTWRAPLHYSMTYRVLRCFQE